MIELPRIPRSGWEYAQSWFELAPVIAALVCALFLGRDREWRAVAAGLAGAYLASMWGCVFDGIGRGLRTAGMGEMLNRSPVWMGLVGVTAELWWSACWLYVCLAIMRRCRKWGRAAQCPRCRRVLTPDVRQCPRCGIPVTVRMREVAVPVKSVTDAASITAT